MYRQNYFFLLLNSGLSTNMINSDECERFTMKYLFGLWCQSSFLFFSNIRTSQNCLFGDVRTVKMWLWFYYTDNRKSKNIFFDFTGNILALLILFYFCIVIVVKIYLFIEMWHFCTKNFPTWILLVNLNVRYIRCMISLQIAR